MQKNSSNLVSKVQAVAQHSTQDFMNKLRKAGDELIDAKSSLEMANNKKIEELADIKNSTCSEIANL